MKPIYKLSVLLLFIVCITTPKTAKPQTQEAIQLALNIKKLAQLRKILKNMYDAYKILSEGYNRIKNIASGNYKIHELFLDGLYAVNPNVRNYKRVGDIINYQARILKEYRRAFDQFKTSNLFTSEEIEYISRVYARLTDQSLQNITELTMVLTAGKLRMSDDERLQAIDRIYKDMEDKLTFLKEFNNSTGILELQRRKQQNDVNTMRTINGIKN